MKKEFILAGLLAAGFASAQTDKDYLGKVGINIMTPQATIDIRPNDDNRQETATTNEGILIPKLSKTRVANIKDVLLVEGTLVYVTDDASSRIASYTGADAKVAKITEKGYYYYNGTEWVKVAIGSSISANLYTADGTLTGNRKVVMGDKILSFEGSDNAKYLEVKNASWYPLVVNSTNAQGGGIAVHPNNLENRIELSANAKGDMRFYQHGNGDVMFVQKSTNRVGIGTETPKAKLDVNGGVRALQGIPQGDSSNLGYAFGSDGDTGLFAVADPTNSNISTNLDLYVNNVSRVNINQQGDVKVTTLAGDGDKIVMANNDGTLTKGVSVSSFATSNIYTADGVLSSDRVVNQAGKWLDFNDGGVRITGNSGVYFPLTVNAMASGGNGGISIQPNGDHAKRVELNTTPEGNFRLWADGDKIYVNRTTGNVGIGTNNPALKLHVAGNAQVGNYENNAPGSLILDATADVEGGQITILKDKTHGTKDWHIDQYGGNGIPRFRIFSGENDDLGLTILENGNTGLGTVNPVAKLDVTGDIIARGQTGQIEAYFGGDGIGNDVEIGSIKSGVTDVTLYNRTDSKAMKLVSGAVEARGAIKSTTLAGTGDRVVLADATGVLKTGTLPASSLSTPVRTVAAAYTLAVADNNGYVYVNSTSPITVTVPSALPAGFSCVVVQQGAGQVTLAGSGVTLQTARGTKTRTQYSAVGVIKRTTAEATITGDAIN